MLTVFLFVLAACAWLFYGILIGWALGVSLGRLVGIFIVAFILGLEISYQNGYTEKLKGLGVWKALWFVYKKTGAFQR